MLASAPYEHSIPFALHDRRDLSGGGRPAMRAGFLDCIDGPDPAPRPSAHAAAAAKLRALRAAYERVCAGEAPAEVRRDAERWLVLTYAGRGAGVREMAADLCYSVGTAHARRKEALAWVARECGPLLDDGTIWGIVGGALNGQD